eukprot:m.21193 g.21193  ORF g.21193 m.21193 type:complete len:171 (+) comp7072_c0_seq1:137-649(+)
MERRSGKGKKDNNKDAPEKQKEQMVLRQMATPKVDDTAGIIFGSIFGVIVGVAVGLIHGVIFGVLVGVGIGLAMLFSIELIQTLGIEVLVGAASGAALANGVDLFVTSSWGVSRVVAVLDSVMVGVVFGVVVGWSFGRNEESEYKLSANTSSPGPTTVTMLDFFKGSRKT